MHGHVLVIKNILLKAGKGRHLATAICYSHGDEFTFTAFTKNMTYSGKWTQKQQNYAFDTILCKMGILEPQTTK